MQDPAHGFVTLYGYLVLAILACCHIGMEGSSDGSSLPGSGKKMYPMCPALGKRDLLQRQKRPTSEVCFTWKWCAKGRSAVQSGAFI